MEGTKAFFAQAIELHDDPPKKVATDGLASYPRAISEELGEDVEHEVLDDNRADGLMTMSRRL
ncbi:hypothetical protein AM1_B0380 (plasmid) [Acaryochloris marina MBIC11017]|uniref:DDE domain-containing protein n=2 Tax=Acaryochloris marina TaxID=155978 RepID=A8ZLS1_ACAM1|nr:hypothetical protein AM1_B0380 [Acaryochloris marina MBIC11017]